MEIVVSSSKATILSKYEDLNTLFTYKHKENEARDFKLFAAEPLLLEVNKNNGLEYLHVKNDEESGISISRIRKVAMSEVVCVACPKQGLCDIACGYSKGNIKLLNHQGVKTTARFQSAKLHDSVIFLDINASDEYLASVYESGVINIYGLKTKILLENINFDNKCKLSRFNPMIKNQLAVASCTGSVFVYDILSKKCIYKPVQTHAAPCGDICMTPAQPNLIYSAGFDCVVNIYDTKKKYKVDLIKCQHPLSSIAVSDCGNYCCIGNLRGELLSYDLRSTKIFLECKQVHNGSVVRVAFAPKDNEGKMSLLKLECSEISTQTRKSTQFLDQSSHKKRDSFIDGLEMPVYKSKSKTLDRLSMKRDSFDWELLKRRHSDVQTQYKTLHEVQTNADNNSEETVRKGSDDIAEAYLTSNVNINDRKNTLFEESAHPLYSIKEDKLLSDSDKVILIQSDDSDESIEKKFSEHHGERIQRNLTNLSNKEIEGFLKLPDDRNSTPNQCKRQIDTKSDSTPPIENIMQELKSMRSEMNSKFNQLEFEIRYQSECNKWSIFTQNYNLWIKQMSVCEEIKDKIEYAFQIDALTNEIIKLRQENSELKQALLQLTK